MALKKVSVVIPAYNADKFIAESIESALYQTIPVHQLIVVNDGSSDQTSRVARSFGEKVFVIDKPNGGVSAARNTGAQHATGEWLVFLDADDVMVATAVQHLLELTDDDRYGVIYGGIIEFDRDTGKIWPRGGSNSAGLPPYPSKANFSRAVIVTPGAAMVRIDLHHKIGGFEKPWQPTEDRDYWMKLGAITGFRYCDEIVLEKRSHDSQSISKYDETLNWGMMVQLEFLEWLDKQGIDKGFLGTNPKKIAHDTIKKLVIKRKWNILGSILDTLKDRGISSPFIALLQVVSWFKHFVILLHKKISKILI